MTRARRRVIAHKTKINQINTIQNMMFNVNVGIISRHVIQVFDKMFLELFNESLWLLRFSPTPGRTVHCRNGFSPSRDSGHNPGEKSGQKARPKFGGSPLITGGEG